MHHTRMEEVLAEKEKQIEISRKEAVQLQILEEAKRERIRQEEEDRQQKAKRIKLTAEIALREKDAERKRLDAKRLEVERERIEVEGMASMEAYSIRAWEYEKIIADELMLKEANTVYCPVCTDESKFRRKRRSRRAVKSLEEAFESIPSLLSPALISQQAFSRVRAPADLSAVELKEKNLKTELMGNHWLSEAQRSIAESAGKTFLYGVSAPRMEELLHILNDEIKSLPIHEIKKSSLDESIIPASDQQQQQQQQQQQKQLNVEAEGPLLQALVCWQKWIITSGTTLRSVKLKSTLSSAPQDNMMVPCTFIVPSDSHVWPEAIWGLKQIGRASCRERVLMSV